MQDDLEAPVPERGLDPVPCGVVGVRVLGEVFDQGFLDGEHGVGFDVLAAADDDVGGQFPGPGGGDEEVDVCGPVGVAVGGGQEYADGAVGGGGVVHRDHGPEVEPALVVLAEQRPAVADALDSGLLDVIEALGVGLPDVADTGSFLDLGATEIK